MPRATHNGTVCVCDRYQCVANSIGMDTPKVGAVISNVGSMSVAALSIGAASLKARARQ